MNYYEYMILPNEEEFRKKEKEERERLSLKRAPKKVGRPRMSSGTTSHYIRDVPHSIVEMALRSLNTEGVSNRDAICAYLYAFRNQDIDIDYNDVPNSVKHVLSEKLKSEAEMASFRTKRYLFLLEKLSKELQIQIVISRIQTLIILAGIITLILSWMFH